MITTTSRYNTVLEYIKKGMTAIFANYWVTVSGCILLALFLSLLLARKGQRQSYTFKWETPWIYHVLHMIILIITSVGVLFYVRTALFHFRDKFFFIY